MPEVIARSLERRQTQVIVQGHSFNTLTTPVEIETTIEVVVK